MKETKIVIVSHDEAVALSEKSEKTIPHIRLEESLRRSVILPEEFHQPVRIGSSDNRDVNFTISGTLIGKNTKLKSFDILMEDGSVHINCDDNRIYEIISKIVAGCMDENSYVSLKEIVEGGWYRHYKGGIYQILCVATHTESGEEQVIYKGKTKGRIWARPKSMFMDGRFQPIEQKEG